MELELNRYRVEDESGQIWGEPIYADTIEMAIEQFAAIDDFSPDNGYFMTYTEDGYDYAHNGVFKIYADPIE